MHAPIAALWRFLFSPSDGAFESLSREVTTTRASLEVMGTSNLKQWMGAHDDITTIAGTVWPEIQLPGMMKLEDIASFARTGMALPLMSGFGRIRGLFGIETVRIGEGEIELRGFPGEITFEIELVKL